MSTQDSYFSIVFVQIINSGCFFFLNLKKKSKGNKSSKKKHFFFLSCHPQKFINIKHKKIKKKKMMAYYFSRNSYLLMHKLILRSDQRSPFGN